MAPAKALISAVLCIVPSPGGRGDRQALYHKPSLCTAASDLLELLVPRHWS
jgi:hypothetical protein